MAAIRRGVSMKDDCVRQLLSKREYDYYRSIRATVRRTNV